MPFTGNHQPKSAACTADRIVLQFDFKKYFTLYTLRTFSASHLWPVSSPIRLTCTSLDCSRKPEHPEEAHAGKEQKRKGPSQDLITVITLPLCCCL